MSIHWPRDPDAILQRLNSWDKQELEAYEEPKSNYIVSGETNGLVTDTKELLQALGWDIQWNPTTKAYSLTGLEGQPSPKDWQEKDPKLYCGRYFTDAFLANSECNVRAEIELRSNGDTVEAWFRVFPADDSRTTASAQLQDVRLSANQVATAPIVIKAGWPYYLPKHFEGRFVEPEMLIFDGKSYRRHSTASR